MTDCVLIFGGTGLVGESLVSSCLAGGLSVISISRKRTTGEERLLTISADVLRDAEKIIEMARDCTASATRLIAINCMWSGKGGLTLGSLHDQMLNAPRAIRALEISKELGADRFINIGSCEEDLIQQYVAGNWIEGPYEHGHVEYALSKLATREQLTLGAYLNKIDFVHVRFSTAIFEARQPRGYISRSIALLRAGLDIEHPTSLAPYNIISGADLVNGIKALFNTERNQRNYFLGCANDISLKDFFNIVKKYYSQDSKNPYSNEDISDDFKCFFSPTAFENADLYSADTGLPRPKSYLEKLTGVDFQ